MPEQHEGACELYEAEEVFDVVFPTSDQPAVVLHPGEDPFDLPSAPVSAQRSAILRLLLPIGTIGRDHLNTIFLCQRLIQRIGVISLVANQSLGQLIEEASGQNSFHKLALGR